MVRRGRSAPAPQRTSMPARAAPAPAAHPPAHAPAQTPMMAPQQAQQPSMFKQMAATAGGVAVGSAVGHVVGAGLTGMFSGGGSSHPEAVAAPAAAAAPASLAGPQEPVGACAWEIKQFLQCAQQQSDLSLCQGFNEAIRQCKEMNRLEAHRARMAIKIVMKDLATYKAFNLIINRAHNRHRLNVSSPWFLVMRRQDIEQ